MLNSIRKIDVQRITLLNIALCKSLTLPDRNQYHDIIARNVSAGINE